tara:strand:- start:5158 stop:5574 length:417 start_codon:yes stop_codon:yes gene_type:complete
MIVTLIPPEYINKEWSKAAPLILKGIQYDGGRWNIGAVYTACTEGLQHLFVVYDDKFENMKAALTTKFVDYPNIRGLQVLFTGGYEGDLWFPEMNKILKGWAKDNNCKFVEFTGRKGWQRKLDKLGWKPEYVSFRMEV